MVDAVVAGAGGNSLRLVRFTAACASADPEAFTKADSEAIRTRSQALVTAFNGKQLDAIRTWVRDGTPLVDEDTEAKARYQIVGEFEADVREGKISISSPIARACAGPCRTIRATWTARAAWCTT